MKVASLLMSREDSVKVARAYPGAVRVGNLDEHEAVDGLSSVLAKWRKAAEGYGMANRYALRYLWRSHRYKVSKRQLGRNVRGNYFRRPDVSLRNRLWFGGQRKGMVAVRRVKVTGNNVIMSARSLGGRTLLTITGGAQQLARRKGPLATEKMYGTMLKLLARAKVSQLYVEKDGPGVFLKSFRYGMRKAGIRVRGIADVTAQAHNGTRPKGPRRV